VADTSVQTGVERWVRSVWLPREYGCSFYRDGVRLTCGGVHSFGAVSGDGQLIASISTSSAMTPGGKRGAGKLLKIRSDMYFMLLAEDVDQRLILFTEPDMLELCEEERARGKVPDSICFRWVGLPQELVERLTAARRVASREVNPRRREG